MTTITQLITQLIELLKLYLSKQKEPDIISMAPPAGNDPENQPESKWEPTIVKVKGVKYKIRGKFKTKSGKAMGAVVHYTVSGRSAASAISVVKYLASQGLGCLVMDENGVFYCAENYDYRTDVVYHAGESAWNGKTGMSQYCIGLEICNWGTDALKQKVKDVRVVTAEANVKAGTYQAYTSKQEEVLFKFLQYEKARNSEFSYDWVIGHDECAPKRKQDPGGSLSITMPELRKKLKLV